MKHRKEKIITALAFHDKKNKNATRLAILLALGVFSPFSPNLAQAATCTLSSPTTWNISGNGNWSTGADWSGGVFPNNSATNVCISNGTSNVTLDANTSISVASLELAAGNTLSQSNNSGLNVYGSQINNAGTISLNNAGNFTVLVINSGGTTTLQGGGNVTLGDSPFNRIYSGVVGSVLDNIDNTISGAGEIFTNVGLKINNEVVGIIDATGGNALRLENFTGVNTLTNNGILRSSNTTAGNGGLILFGSTVDNTGNSNSGRITANGVNTHVDLNGANILGGTLATSGGGVIQTVSSGGGSTLDGSGALAPVNITSGSTVQVNNNSGLGLVGTINNAGTITLNSAGNNTDLIIGTGGTVTLQGGGQVTLGDNPNNRIYSNTAGSVLDNVNNTISGAGQIFTNIGLKIKNEASGIIDATGANALSLSSFTGGTTLVNNGILRSSNTGGLVISGTTVDNTGNGNGGVITAVGAGSHVELNSSTVIGGTLNASGGGVINTNNAGLDGSASQVNISSGTNVHVNNATGLSLLGTVNNLGTISLNSAGNNTDLIVGTGGTVTLQGSGHVTLGDNISNRIYSNTAGSVLDNVNNTISGAGQIFANIGLKIRNEATGIIDANATNQLQLRDFSGANTLVNNGFLRSSNTAVGNGGLLILNTTVDNTGNGNGGKITAIGANTHVDLNNSTLQGGTLTASGGGVFQTVSSSTSTLDGSAALAPINIASGTNIVVNNATALDLLGTINNAGTIQVNSVGNATLLRVADGTQLTGGGAITLSANTNNYLFGVADSGTETVTNVNNTISGAGHIGWSNSLLFVNQAIIDANDGTSLILAPTTNASMVAANGGGFVNQGTLESTNSGGLYLNGGVFNNKLGTIQAVGTGNNVYLYNSTTVAGGTMQGVNGGMVETLTGYSAQLDGSSQGAITLAGTYLANNASTTVLNGTVNNTGTIQLNSAGNVTNLLVADGTQLTGGGKITLSDNTQNYFYGVTNSGTETVTNVNNTISGAGHIGWSNSLLFINKSVINADGTNTLTLQPTTIDTTGLVTANGGGFVNQGTMEATNTGGLGLNGGVFNNKDGTIQAVGTNNNVYLFNGTTVAGGTLQGVNGGMVETVVSHSALLDGSSQGAITLVGTYLANTASTTVLKGTINNTGNLQVNSAGNVTNLLVADGTHLTGGGTMTLSDNTQNYLYGATNTGSEVLTNVNNTIQGAGHIGWSSSIGIVNSGIINATGGNALLLAPNTALPVGLDNLSGGVLRGSGAGGLSITQGTTTNEAGGVVEALANSSVTFQNGANISNLSSNTLTGGIWKANSVGGSSATVSFLSPNTTIGVNNADIYLIGANSVIQGFNGTNMASIDNTLTNNLGSLRLQQGRTFVATANSGNFLNGSGALIELSDSTFQANHLTLANATSTVNSFGTSALTTNDQIIGNGQINVSNGTLSVAKGFNLSPGSAATISTGANLNLASATAASTIGTVTTSGGIALGSNNLNVTKDYNNANTGTGNSYNARANITGTGQIVGVNAAQAITGAGTPTSANTYTLDIGNVRGGTSKTVNYQIANTGTGADIRGAIQTGAPGLGNLTDGRLSGAGVTAGNFGPIAASANSGNLAVTFNAIYGGSLSGQNVAVVSNLSNVATQVVNLTGTASALALGASPNMNPTTDLGAFHVGSAGATQGFIVANTTSGPGAERLGIASANTTGNFAGVNNLGAGFIAGGAFQTNAVTASVSGGVAGVNSGSLAIQYTSNGELIAPTFTTQNSNTGNTILTATGYNLATGNVNNSATNPDQKPTAVVLANQRVNGTLTQGLTMANSAPTSAYSETLSAGFGSNTGNATNNSGTVSGLVAGGSGDTTSLKVGVDTSQSGARSGTVAVNLTSNAISGSGLSNSNLTAQTVNVSGNVYQAAVGHLDNPIFLNFGTVQVGQSVSQLLSISNIATGTAGFVEDLNAQFGSSSGTGANQISGSGSISGLTAGSTNNTGMTVNVNTGTAGTINGAIGINYFTAGAVNSVSNGLGTAAAGSDSFSVQGLIQSGGQVINQANPVLNTPTVSLDNVRVNGAFANKFVSLTNQATTPPQAALNASIAPSAAPVTASGSFTLLNPGSTNANTLQVGINDTATAGLKSGKATVSLVSDASNVGGCAPNCQITLAPQDVNVNGKVYQVAQPNLPTSVNLGNYRIGSNASQAISIQNTNLSPTGYQEGLNVALNSSSGGATSTGFITNLAAGSSSTSVGVGLAVSGAGIQTGGVKFDLATNGSGTSGLATASIGTGDVQVNATGYRLANPTLNTPTVNLAARVGDANPTQAISLTNTSPDQYTEGLKATPGTAPSGFTASGSVTNLAAQGTSTAISVGLQTGTSGTYGGNLALGLKSTGTGTTGAADVDLTSQNVSLNGKVYATAVANTNTASPVDFGIVHINQSVAAKNISVTNGATGALTDTLTGNFGTVTGPFSGTGSLGGGSGIAAGQTDASNLNVSLNTGTAGIYNDSAQLQFKSHNTDMTDLSLTAKTMALFGQVNNYAEADFSKLAGNGSFTGIDPTHYVLDLGNIYQNSAASTTLGVTNGNAANGPADDLDGLFSCGGSSCNSNPYAYFSFLGFNPFSNLAVGQSLGGFSINVITTALGAFDNLITFKGLGHNASGYSGLLTDITLELKGSIVERGANVPEPGSIGLMGVGALAWLSAWRLRRRVSGSQISK